MVNDKKLIVSASPHVHSSSSSSRIMLDVIIALLPALAAAIAIFGPRVIAVAATTIITAVLAEYLARKAMKRSYTLGDLSAVVTGLLLALNLPVGIPLWIAGLGSVIAIIVVKQFFGGIGQNFVNPAITARIILLASFPGHMGSGWAAPLSWKSVDAVTSATPLAKIAANDLGSLPSLSNMLLGVRAGSLGETCAIALIIGGIYLMIRKVISPAIPLTYIGTVAVIAFLAKGDLSFVAYELLGGGLLIGSIFMATDYSTCPINFKGKLVFGVGCGLITMVIRLFGSLPEGVSYAILLMNIFVPLIERATTPKPFGTLKEEKKSKDDKKEAAKA